jgi:nucleoid-associated protein YgaU
MALDLGRQVGPMPLGAWIAVVGTGIGVAVWSRGTGSGTTPTVTRDTSNDPGVGTLDGEDAVGTGPSWTAVPPPTTPPGVAAYTDNDAWGTAAINFLIARGYDPGLSQSAIAHALQGSDMSIREFALWTVALSALGAPPFAIDIAPPTALPPPTVQPPTPPPPAPAPAAGSWVWVTSADTLHTAAVKAYGPASNRWDDIYKANRDGVRRPDGIAPNLTGGPGWLSSDFATRPGLHFHTSGRWLFAPR